MDSGVFILIVILGTIAVGAILYQLQGASQRTVAATTVFAVLVVFILVRILLGADVPTRRTLVNLIGGGIAVFAFGYGVWWRRRGRHP